MLADSEATVLFQDTQARGNRGSGSGPLPLQVSHPSLLIATYYRHAAGAHKSLAWGAGTIVW